MSERHEDLKPGDTVRLRVLYSPQFVIDQIDGDEASVIWYHEDEGELRSQWLKTAVLERVERT